MSQPGCPETIAIDLGASKTMLAYFINDKLEKTVSFPTPSTPKDFLVLAKSKIDQLNLQNLTAIGVGAAGYWDNNCILKQSLNLEQYIDYPLWLKLSSMLNVPLFLKSDVEAAVIGEAVFALNEQYDSVLYVNMGTGFSGALYKDGQVFSTDYSPTIRLEFLVQAELTQAKKQAEQAASDISSIAHLSSTLVNLAFILSPQIICIGGGKTNQSNWDKIIQPAIDKAMPYLNENLCYKIKIQKSKLDNAAIYGAYQITTQGKPLHHQAEHLIEHQSF